MAQIILHNLSNAELIEKRQQVFFSLTHSQRFFETLKLIRATMLFSKTNIHSNRKKIIIK